MIVTITGLPRSGTAFLGSALSQLLCYEGVRTIAFHELSSYGKDWKEVLKNASHKYDYVINSSTTAHHPDMIHDMDQKVIKITQHPELSFLKTVNALSAGPVTAHNIRQAIYKSFEILQDYDPLSLFSIQREKVFTRDGLLSVVKFIDYYLSGWDSDKADEILKLKVTHKMENLMKNFTEGVYK